MISVCSGNFFFVQRAMNSPLAKYEPVQSTENVKKLFLILFQAPERFVAAVARNPVCNLSIMVGTTDIPDWCYTEAFGKEGKNFFSEAPTVENLQIFYEKSPISHLPKVGIVNLFLASNFYLCLYCCTKSPAMIVTLLMKLVVGTVRLMMHCVFAILLFFIMF